ncbi:hypothetical protein EC843_101682 [Buttiauxella sp. JUb87]|jgi:hypothetical protein|uniref:hypothetical protein n=1 Tax=Buttiauxella sp. JUb87 TaxID=2485129 RepID=UPI00105FAFCB|nr:hypothetical protein [Buttiauxella sp. JUb87]TDN54636.1 hypothetical protein EC843_101682 [Buttiauxella sp. JUb87]
MDNPDISSTTGDITVTDPVITITPPGDDVVLPPGDGDNSGAITIPGTVDNPEIITMVADLVFDGAPLPDFNIPDETPREKELREQLEALRQQTGADAGQHKALVVEPQKPKRDEFYSDEAFEEAFEQYITDREQFKQQQTSQVQAKAAHKAQFEEAVGHYVQQRADAALKLKDFDRIEKYVDDNLNPGVLAAILFGNQNGTFTNAPEMIAAIGRNPALMKQLNEINNPFLAGAMLLDISKKSQRAPDAPGKQVNAIPEVSGGSPQSLDAELAQAEEEAERTGDRTKVIELRAKKRDQKK